MWPAVPRIKSRIMSPYQRGDAIYSRALVIILSSMPPPTRVRYSVLGMLCLLAMITYMDRAMYGSAKGDLMAAVGQPVAEFFWVLTAFQIAYAIFEIPVGWMGDRFGP